MQRKTKGSIKVISVVSISILSVCGIAWKGYSILNRVKGETKEAQPQKTEGTGGSSGANQPTPPAEPTKEEIRIAKGNELNELFAKYKCGEIEVNGAKVPNKPEVDIEIIEGVSAKEVDAPRPRMQLQGAASATCWSVVNNKKAPNKVLARPPEKVGRLTHWELFYSEKDVVKASVFVPPKPLESTDMFQKRMMIALHMCAFAPEACKSYNDLKEFIPDAANLGLQKKPWVDPDQ